MAHFRLVLFLLLAAVAAILIFQNAEVVSLKFLFWQISMSQVILMPIVFGLGFIMGIIALLLWKRKKRENT